MPLYLLRILRLDDSDRQIYAPAAGAGELAVPGAFMFTFADTDPGTLEGPAHEALRHGFLGVDSLGWGTLVTVGEATAEEREHVLERLTEIFLTRFGAPDSAAARAQAEQELSFADRLCQQPVNTILSVEREVNADGHLRERFHTHRQRAAWDGDHPVFSMLPENDPAFSGGDR